MEGIDGNDYKQRADIVDREYREETEERYVVHESGEVFRVLGRLYGARRPYHPEGWNGQPTLVLEDRDGNQLEVHPDNPRFRRV